MNLYWRRKNLANWNPARIPPQTPPAGGKSAEAKRKILFPRKTDFRFAESALKPHALPEYLEGRTPKEKHPFLFQKKSGARKIKNARSVFSFGVAGVLASAWGFLRIICFGNRFELGTINTPQSNFQEFCRPIQPREARQRTETLAHRARRGSPSAGSSQRFLWQQPFSPKGCYPLRF